MKKIILSLMIVVFGLCQMANAQIPNPGFENWAGGNPVDWATSNVFEAGLITITQTSDVYSGTSAVKGEVVSFFGNPMAAVIQSGSDATGFPITEQYRMFELYYKFTSVGGDKFSVNVGFEKNGIPIAQGAVANPTNVGAYTHLSVPMTYMIEDIPDHANIQISITGPVAGPDVHIGSIMYIDDLSFSLETGIDDKPAGTMTARCYPNPASDMIYVQLDNKITGDIAIKVFDIFGKEVKSILCEQQPGNGPFQVDTGDLASGLYFYSITGQGNQYTGKFNISR